MVCPVGLSPPVVTEFFKYLREKTEYYPFKFILIGTKNEMVRGGIKIIKYSIWEVDKKIDIREVYVDYDDVDSQDAATDFISKLGNTLIDGLKDDPNARILINIAGGRKSMVVISTLIAQLIRPSRVYHVIHKDIKLYNEKLKRMENKIKLISRLSGDESYNFFKKYYNEFMELMYPPIEDLSIMEIPLLPYPRKMIEVLIRVLKNPVEEDKLDLNKEEIDELISAGIIERRKLDDRIFIYPTKSLKMLENIIIKS